MMSVRRARVNALAKINLSLKVLDRRPDGFHELRTVFQTISLADTLDIEFEPSPHTSIEITGTVDIPDNLVGRAAALALDAAACTGRVKFRLRKRIPMGAGLGGGSSDAAAVLLALPVMAGRHIESARLIELAGELGSDVPFFLLGGTAVGLGRGSELYPLPEQPPARGLLVAPDVHVSTAEAYKALGRSLTSGPPQNIISSFQSSIWHWWESPLGVTPAVGENDFESVVFARHPHLQSLKRQLEDLGASAALLSGSGSALFGIFRRSPDLQQARRCFREGKVYPIQFVSRARYRSMWWRRLAPHISGKIWPPLSRYA